MSIAPSEHRVYYRQRTNPRVPAGVHVSPGPARTPCDAGSRWHRYSFSPLDKYKAVVVADIGGSKFSLSVDGVVRTEVDQSTLAQLSAATANYYVCEVNEQEGTMMLATDAECAAKLAKLSNNPPLTQTTVDPLTTLVITNSGDATLSQLR